MTLDLNSFELDVGIFEPAKLFDQVIHIFNSLVPAFVNKKIQYRFVLEPEALDSHRIEDIVSSQLYQHAELDNSLSSVGLMSLYTGRSALPD